MNVDTYAPGLGVDATRKVHITYGFDTLMSADERVFYGALNFTDETFSFSEIDHSRLFYSRGLALDVNGNPRIVMSQWETALGSLYLTTCFRLYY